MRRLARLARDSRGATAIEYGLIVSLIVIAMLGAFMTFASGTGSIWTNVHNDVVNA